MTNIVKMFLVIIGLILVYYAYTNYVANKEAEYVFIGTYKYEIKNDSLFNETYLSEHSYGYVISGLSIQGLEMKGIEALDRNDEYIISLNHPVKKAYINSKAIREEGMSHTKKKPLDIILDTEKYEESIFLYKLVNKGKYRLILP